MGGNVSKNEEKNVIKKNLKKIIVIFPLTFSLVLIFFLILYINNSIETARDMGRKVLVEGPLLHATGVISECKKIGGTVIFPLDKNKGGGQICNLSVNGLENEWQSMPTLGNYQYQYRTINDKVVSGGSEEKDMAICYVGPGTTCELK
jgi:hypothetical protein